MVIRSHGMCQTCYQKSISRYDTCDVCGEYKRIKYKRRNICAKCDTVQRRNQRKEQTV